jgi:hypothetical protein
MAFVETNAAAVKAMLVAREATRLRRVLRRVMGARMVIVSILL